MYGSRIEVNTLKCICTTIMKCTIFMHTLCADCIYLITNIFLHDGLREQKEIKKICMQVIYGAANVAYQYFDEKNTWYRLRIVQAIPKSIPKILKQRIIGWYKRALWLDRKTKYGIFHWSSEYRVETLYVACICTCPLSGVKVQKATILIGRRSLRYLLDLYPG